MKITKERLNKIIKEEIEAVLDEGGRGFFSRMLGRPNKELQKYLDWWEKDIDDLHVKFDELQRSQSTDGEAYAKILRAIIKARREFSNNTMIEPWDPNVPGSGDWHTGNDDQKADRKRIFDLQRDLYRRIAKSKEVAYEVRQAAEEAKRQAEEEERRQARASSGSGGWDSSTAERQCRDEHRADLRKGYDRGYRNCIERAEKFARDQGRRE